MKERIKKYLANGMKAEQVASVVGCSPAYISQLLKDENYKKEVEAALLDNKTPEDEIMADRYLGLESKIIQQMGEAIIGAELPHLTRALDSVVKAQAMKQGKLTPRGGQTLIQNVVNLQLPAHLLKAPEIQLNEKSEVIAINAKPLAPMPAEGVRSLFEKITVQRNLNEFEERNDLPNSQTPAIARSA